MEESKMLEILRRELKAVVCVVDNVLKAIQDLSTAIKSNQAQEKYGLTMREAARYLNISLSGMQKLSASGKIHKTRPNGGKAIFLKSDLDRWAKRNGGSAVFENVEN